MIIKLVKLFLIKIISNTKYRTFLNEFKLCDKWTHDWEKDKMFELKRNNS